MDQHPIASPYAQLVVLTVGPEDAAGVAALVNDANPLPVNLVAGLGLPAFEDGRLPVSLPPGGGGLTDDELRAVPLPVSIVGASVTLNVDELEDVDISDRAGRLLGHVAVDSLPAGLATEATLATLATDAGLASVFTRLGDGSQHVVIDSMPDGGASLTDDELRASPVAVSGAFYPETQPVSAAALPLPSGAATSAKQDTGNTSCASIDGKITACNTGAVVVSSSALPSGAATSAKQDTGNASCASIDGKITACNTGAVVVSSSALPSGAATSAKQDTGNSSIASVDGKITACNTGAVVVSSSALPSGAATSAKQDTGNTSCASIDGKITACNTGAVVVSSSALPSGAATSAKQDTGNTSCASIDGKLPATLGQKAMAASLSVAIASDQGNLPVQLKDSGRVRCTIKFQSTATATGDTILSLTKQLAGVDGSPATTIAVTAAKRLRITNISFSVKAGAAAAAFATLTLRTNPSGNAIISSPSFFRIDLGNTGATIGAADKVDVCIPDGLEFSGAEQICASLAAQATTNIISVTLSGYEYTP